MARIIPRIDSRETALAAVKMAGLPNFLIGFGYGFLGFFALLGAGAQPTSQTVGAIVQIVISIALVTIALCLRRGLVGFLLPSVFITVACYGYAFYVTSLPLFMPFGVVNSTWLILQILLLIVPTIMLMFAIHGARAWFWLRNHRHEAASI